MKTTNRVQKTFVFSSLSVILLLISTIIISLINGEPNVAIVYITLIPSSVAVISFVINFKNVER